jgi:hypothetical protein
LPFFPSYFSHGIRGTQERHASRLSLPLCGIKYSTFNFVYLSKLISWKKSCSLIPWSSSSATKEFPADSFEFSYSRKGMLKNLWQIIHTSPLKVTSLRRHSLPYLKFAIITLDFVTTGFCPPIPQALQPLSISCVILRFAKTHFEWDLFQLRRTP